MFYIHTNFNKQMTVERPPGLQCTGFRFVRDFPGKITLPELYIRPSGALYYPPEQCVVHGAIVRAGADKFASSENLFPAARENDI